VPAGEVLMVELPGTLGNGSDVLALALTPTIRRIGSSGATEALWIGTESTFQAPSAAASESTTTDEPSSADLATARTKPNERLAARQARAGGGS
jgi:hypothetical protein